MKNKANVKEKGSLKQEMLENPEFNQKNIVLCPKCGKKSLSSSRYIRAIVWKLFEKTFRQSNRIHREKLVKKRNNSMIFFILFY